MVRARAIGLNAIGSFFCGPLGNFGNPPTQFCKIAGMAAVFLCMLGANLEHHKCSEIITRFEIDHGAQKGIINLRVQSSEIRCPSSHLKLQRTCVSTYAVVKADPSIRMDFQDFPMPIRVPCYGNYPSTSSMVSSIRSSPVLGSGSQSLPFQALLVLRGGGQTDSKRRAVQIKVKPESPRRDLGSKGKRRKMIMNDGPRQDCGSQPLNSSELYSSSGMSLGFNNFIVFESWQTFVFCTLRGGAASICKKTPCIFSF